MPALIYDCDGVLADTEADGHLPAFNQAFAEVGLPVRWDRAAYAEKLKIGGGKERIASAFTPELDAAAGVAGDAERAEWIKRLHVRKTELFTQRVNDGLLPGRPGVRRLIDEALAAGWVVAVASTSAEPSVRAVLSHVVGDESAQRCHVFAGDIVAAKKPAPDIYLKVVADLGLDPRQCVVVEDSGIGVAAARAAGLTTIVTISSFTAEDDFSGAALVLSDLGDPGAPATVVEARGGNVPEGYVRLADVAALLRSDHGAGSVGSPSPLTQAQNQEDGSVRTSSPRAPVRHQGDGSEGPPPPLTQARATGTVPLAPTPPATPQQGETP